MEVLFVETFYGGSHKDFADQWAARSSHRFTLETLPARFWKWRQAGSALYLAGKLPPCGHFDVVAVSGMIDLAHLKALRPDLPPCLLYVHENQFDYPLSPGEARDFRYGLTDLANVSCAEAAAFNSAYNRDSFLEGCLQLFSRLPDARPLTLVEEARRKIRIAPPGIDASAIDAAAARVSETSPAGPSGRPLVIWNHRHEHDKDPDTTFRVLARLAARGIEFSLAILGQRFPDEPEAFDRARRELAPRIVFDGYPDRKGYFEWLARGTAVVSSALQENFGLSVIEAARAGCFPMVPKRLAYPEVLPDSVHEACLWRGEEEYEAMLEKILTSSDEERRRKTEPLARWLDRYDWAARATALDGILEEISR